MDLIIKNQQVNFLTPEEKAKIELLPVSLKEFAIARQERPFSSLNNNDQLEFCLFIITRFYSFCGINNDKKTLAFQTNFLNDELSLRQFSGITCSEIMRAFEMGQRNEFGQYFGPCQKTYSLFLNSYIKHPLRLEANNQFQKLLKEAEVKKTEKPVALKFIEDKESCIRAFNEFCINGNLPFAGSRYYYFLSKEAKIVNFDINERKSIASIAEKKYIDNLKLRKMKREITQDEFEKYTFAIDASNPSFVRCLREVALHEFFVKLKNQNIHLKDLLK